MIRYTHQDPAVIRPAGCAFSATPAPREKRGGKVTEIVLHDDELSNMPMLMPLLAQLSRDDRWLVWVAPPVVLPKALLMDAGIDLRKVILLKPDEAHTAYDLSRQALKAGTCHAVITWPGYLSEEELEGLEEAAHTGASMGIVIRRRQHA